MRKKGFLKPMEYVIAIIIGLAIVLALAWMISGFSEETKRGLFGIIDIGSKKTEDSIKIGECNTMCTAQRTKPEPDFKWEVNGESCEEITGVTCDY